MSLHTDTPGNFCPIDALLNLGYSIFDVSPRRHSDIGKGFVRRIGLQHEHGEVIWFDQPASADTPCGPATLTTTDGEVLVAEHSGALLTAARIISLRPDTGWRQIPAVRLLGRDVNRVA